MKFKVLIVISLLTVAGLALNSCKKKPCKEKHQTNNAFNVNDSVYVDSTGLWTPQSYTLDITTCKKDQYELVLFNLANKGDSLASTLGGTTIIISEQEVNGTTYFGNGKWVNENLSINYTYILATGDTLVGTGTGVGQ
ncbi:MAG: hypothetical protein JKY54_06900 [Flavobacteriales bacterium]|nr:hypothetical protein [Flavobacteriales bacterium]